MNKHLDKLYGIARKRVRRIIGLMSGTSLDGLDIALCEIEGHGLSTRVRIPYFTTTPYEATIKTEIRKVFAREQIDFRQLCLLHPWVADIHAGMILQALASWKVDPSEVDLIASHGQTVYHAPRILHGFAGWPDATLQIGDGDHIAARTGIITLSDFRQKHIAAGGEGAPLALYGDYLLFSKAGEDRIMLNMGGIANFTFLSGSLDPHAAVVTDTGPGNTMIDAYVQKHFGLDYDRDAALAKLGTVSGPLLAALLADPFFAAPVPKTTGPELFNLGYLERAQEASGTSGLSHVDVLATLTRMSAEAVIGAVRDALAWRGQSAVRVQGNGVSQEGESAARVQGSEVSQEGEDDMGMQGSEVSREGDGDMGMQANEMSSGGENAVRMRGSGLGRGGKDAERVEDDGVGQGGGNGSGGQESGLGKRDGNAVRVQGSGVSQEKKKDSACRIFVSGGGAHNPLLTEWIAEAMPSMRIQSTDELDVSADAKEALLFAVLANEAVCGEPVDFGRAGMPATTLGKISFPI